MLTFELSFRPFLVFLPLVNLKKRYLINIWKFIIDIITGSYNKKTFKAYYLFLQYIMYYHACSDLCD